MQKILLFITIYIIFQAITYFALNQVSNIDTHQNNKNKVSAFIRVKDEIKTIEACLNSIDGIFDHIVIIHSHEKDDGSINLMTQWCQKRRYCEIHEYPHDVIPSHDIRYSQKFSTENTLSSYYNFGLQFFQPDEWVVKIDADQVYIRPLLTQFLQKFKNGTADENKQYGLTGYNTFVLNNKIVKYSKSEINGGQDSFIIKRKNIDKFFHNKHYESLKTQNITLGNNSQPVWFHFMKTLKSNGKIRELNEAQPNEIKKLSEKEIYLFDTYIRQYLINSPYYSVKFD